MSDASRPSTSARLKSEMRVRPQTQRKQTDRAHLTLLLDLIVLACAHWSSAVRSVLVRAHSWRVDVASRDSQTPLVLSDHDLAPGVCSTASCRCGRQAQHSDPNEPCGVSMRVSRPVTSLPSLSLCVFLSALLLVVRGVCPEAGWRLGLDSVESKSSAEPALTAIQCPISAAGCQGTPRGAQQEGQDGHSAHTSGGPQWWLSLSLAQLALGGPRLIGWCLWLVCLFLYVCSCSWFPRACSLRRRPTRRLVSFWCTRLERR